MKLLPLLYEGFQVVASVWLTIHLFRKWVDAMPVWALAYIATIMVIGGIYLIAWRQW